MTVQRTPSSLNKEALESSGYLVGKTEQWIQRPKQEFGIRRDLFGWIDMIALNGSLTLGIQVTSRACISDHKKKILEDPKICDSAMTWVSGGPYRTGWIVGTDWKKSGRFIVKRFVCFRMVLVGGLLGFDKETIPGLDPF